MLIKLNVAHWEGGDYKFNDIWINPDNIATIEPNKNPNCPAKSYINIKDQYQWRQISVKEEPMEIARIINKKESRQK